MTIGSLLIIVAGVLWGTMGLFVHTLTDVFGYTSMQAACLRITGCALLVFVFVLFTGKDKFRIKIRDTWVFVCNGLISVLCMTSFYFGSISSDTSMSVSAILLYTAPIIVMLLSCVLFKEKFTGKKALALVFAFAGCVLVSVSDNVYATAKGIIFGLLSGVAYALYSIFSTVAMNKGYHSYTVTFWSFLFASVGSWCVCTMPSLISNTEQKMSFGLVVAVVSTGIVTAFLPFMLYTKGLSSTEPGKAAIMASVEPLVATLCGVFRAEALTVSVCLGMAGIIAAIVVLNTRENIAKKQKL